LTILKADSCSIGLCELKAAKYKPAGRFCSRFPLSPTGCQQSEIISQIKLAFHRS
jgi:hypothetical protein